MSKTFRLALATFCVGALTSIGAGAASAQTKTAKQTTTTTSYSISWHHSVYKVGASYGGFSGISCAAVNLCVGVDGAGDVIWSTTPAKATGASWRVASVDASGGGLTGISCPTHQLCVAVDAEGQVIWSTTPRGGVGAWSTPVRIDSALASGGSYLGLAAISCPSTKLCVAIDNSPNGGVLVSRNPTGGASTWRRTILGGGTLTSVSCASTTLCVVTGANTYTATDPRGASANWKKANSAPTSSMFSAVSCVPGAKTCLTVGYGSSSNGFSQATSNVTATSPKWTTSTLESFPATPTEGLLDAVGCPATNFCVAVDSVDNAFVSTTPVRGSWSAPKTLPYIVNTNSSYASATAISCTVRVCVVADSNGFVTGGVVTAKTTSSKAAATKTSTSSKRTTKAATAL